jgi:hypothetical protein
VLVLDAGFDAFAIVTYDVTTLSGRAPAMYDAGLVFGIT